MIFQSSPMGRLTLNVLLSFAQFERETGKLTGNFVKSARFVRF